MKPYIPAPYLKLFSILLITLSVFLACELYPSAPDEDATLDAPLDGISGAQLALHIKGDEEFGRRFAVADGLGPIFVANSCDSCHPAEGKGHPVFNLTRFGRFNNGVFDPLIEQGGPQIQNRAIPGFTPESIPATATGIAVFNAPIVVGLGLLEAVDDATILAMADPNDINGDGISGRPNYIDSTDFTAVIAEAGELFGNGSPTRFQSTNGRYLTRFGKKGSTINLLHQTVSAYHQDMGLTTDFFNNDLFNVNDIGISSEDGAPDPEVPSSVVSNVVFYLKTLRAPLQRTPSNPDVMAGQNIFTQVGCASCHTPVLQTGVSSISQLSEKVFMPYTDLLLHDMGPELDDGYTEGIATTSEWRTAPLWGLGLAEEFQGGEAFLLHDGRAKSIPAAIEFHGGEGSASRTAFRNLSDSEKEQLIKFLKSL